MGYNRDAWLFALALWFEVEVSYLDLSDRSSEAAFALCSLLAGQEEGADADAPEETEENPQLEARLAWDTEEQPLPHELRIIWQGLKAGTRRLELKTVLDSIPRFEEVPVKAPENNHRLDSRRGSDTTVKSWSQRLLHSLRLQAYLYSLMLAAENPTLVKTLFEQHFQLTAELYSTLSNYRKEQSIPGSVQRTEDVLFDKESLALAQQQAKVNRASFSAGTEKFPSLFLSKNHYHSLHSPKIWKIIWQVKIWLPWATILQQKCRSRRPSIAQ